MFAPSISQKEDEGDRSVRLSFGPCSLMRHVTPTGNTYMSLPTWICMHTMHTIVLPSVI